MLNTIILPPDQRKIVMGSWVGREKRELPGYDKVWLIEWRLAAQLAIERSTIHRKTGLLGDNQMRKISYHFTYIPQRDVTIITNNQYGEWTFLAQGERPYHTETKKTNKWWPDFVPVQFNYDDPEEFLVRLWAVIHTIKNTSQEPSQKHDNNINHRIEEKATEYTQEDIISLLQPYRIDFISMQQRERAKRSLVGKHGKKLIGYFALCRLFGYTEKQSDLYKDTIFHSLCEQLFGITVQDFYKELLQPYRTDFLSMWTAERMKRSLTDNTGKKLIGYIDLCRLFGYTEEQNDLYKDTIFYLLCEQLFGPDRNQKD